MERNGNIKAGQVWFKDWSAPDPGDESHAIARTLNVSQVTIANAVSGRYWSHVT